MLLQAGRYIDVWGSYTWAANVSGPNMLTSFTVFNHTDLQNFTDLHAAAGQQCLKDSSVKYANDVKAYASMHSAQCCLDLSNSPDSVSTSDVCMLHSAKCCPCEHKVLEAQPGGNSIPAR